MSALTTWELLISAGYNVIPVDREKRPLAPKFAECYDRRCPELAQLFESAAVRRKQAGVALLGRVNPWYPDKLLAILDIDDPRKLPPGARAILEGAWHWLTGPRCPVCGDKHGIVCERGRCRHGDHEFALSEAIRGEAFAALIPAEAEQLIGSGVLKLLGGAVEIRLRGYQLIPPSIHPSGVTYEWVVPPWRGSQLVHPRELTVEEVRRLLELLGHGAERPAETPPREAPREAAPPKACKKLRELSDDDIAAILDVIRPYYIPGFRNAILYSLLGILKRGCYSEASIRRFYEALQAWAQSAYPDIDRKKDDYILEGVLQGREWHLYGWPKLRETMLQVAQQIGKAPGDAERDIARLRQILAPARARARYCLKYRRGEDGKAHCVRWLRVRDIGDERVMVEVVTAHAKKGPEVSRAAVLPAETLIVRDPYYGEDYFAAYWRGRLLCVTGDWDEFLRTVTSRDEPFALLDRAARINALKLLLPRVERVISAGLHLDGTVVDPRGALDTADYGVEPLRAAFRWIRQAYRGRNLLLAWLNVMATVAKLLTPLLRFVNPTFVDQIVYNVGRGGEGKSTLARYVLTPMLGGRGAVETYIIRLDGAVRSEPQLRNLLSLNRLPLILDEQTKSALKQNVSVILSAAVGMGTTGIHAARYGHGIGARFRNLRGIIVFTNVPFAAFLREAAIETADYALLRRFIELAWDFEPISPEAFSRLPEIRPIYGYAARLWRKYRELLTRAHDLLSLIEALAGAIEREHPNDPEVREMAEMARQAVREIREEKRTERIMLGDGATLIERAYRFVSEELKVSQLSAIRVLRYLLENPKRAGLSFTRPRGEERLIEMRRQLEDALSALRARYAQADGRMPEDAAVVYTILSRLLEEDRVLAVIYARTPLVSGVPKEFLGAPKSVYAADGVTRAGYAVPLHRIVRLFLDADAGEEVERHEPGELKSGNPGELKPGN